MLASSLAVAAALVAGVALARALGARTAVDLVVWTWLLGVALLAGGGIAIGALDRLTPTSLAVVVVALSAAGVGVALSRRPWPPLAPIGPPLREVATGPVLLLAAVSGAVLAYTLALALLTPAAEGDALAYHLARAAFWLQHHGMDPIAGLRDARLDQAPPAPAALAAIGLSIGGAAGAAMAQWTATVVLAVATYGVGRRVGADRTAAALVGLAVPALPVVALQAPTGLTDTLLATLVVTAALLALDTRPASSLLLGAATALALGTKLTASLGLALVAACALLAHRGAVRLRHLAAMGLGAALASVWFLVQRLAEEGGSTIGGQPTRFVGSGGALSAVARATRLLLEVLELPGSAGRDALLPLLVGACLVIAGIVTARQRRALVSAGALVALLGLATPARQALERVYRKGWTVLGEERFAGLGYPRDGTTASALESWYGVVGAVVLVLGIGVAVVAIRQRAFPRATLALAPLATVIGLALVSDWSRYEGRFAMGGFVLGAAACAPALTRPTAAWWLAGASAVAAALALVHFQERPSGLRLLEPVSAASAWTRDDANAMGLTRGMPEILRAVDEEVPPRAEIAIWASPWPDWGPQPGAVVLFPFPFFGPGLERRVALVADAGTATASGADWAVLPTWSLSGCVAGWEPVTPRTATWQLLRRSDGRRCA